MKWIVIFILVTLTAGFSCDMMRPNYSHPIPQKEIQEADSLMMLIDTTRA